MVLRAGEEVEEAGLGPNGDVGGAPLTPFTLYSAHDSTLMALTAAMGSPLQANPDLAAALAIELWRTPSASGGKGEWWVGVTLDGAPLADVGCVPVPPAPLASGEEPRPVCTVALGDFVRATARVTPEDYSFRDWAAECAANAPELGSDDALTEAGGARWMLVLALVSVVVCGMGRRRRRALLSSLPF